MQFKKGALGQRDASRAASRTRPSFSTAGRTLFVKHDCEGKYTHPMVCQHDLSIPPVAVAHCATWGDDRGGLVDGIVFETSLGSVWVRWGALLMRFRDMHHASKKACIVVCPRATGPAFRESVESSRTEECCTRHDHTREGGVLSMCGFLQAN